MTADTALPHVFDATAANFEAEVLRKSVETPVLVDFWAEWCGPCKQLGPVLEKLAGEYNGAFVLAKVDVDKEQELGAAFQVRSIPTVFLVRGGQLVDGFPGVLPEGQLRAPHVPLGLTEDIGITRFCAFTLHAKTGPADPAVRRWVGEVFITHMLPVMAARALDENYDFPARVMELN